MQKFIGNKLLESFANYYISGFPRNLLITVAIFLLGFFVLRFLFPALCRGIFRFCRQTIGLLKTLIIIFLIIFLIALLLTLAINIGGRKGSGEDQNGTGTNALPHKNAGGGEYITHVEIEGTSRESLAVRVHIGRSVEVVRGIDPYFLDKLEQTFKNIDTHDDGLIRDVCVRTGRFVPAAARLQILQHLEWSGNYRIIEKGEP